VWRRSDWT